MEWALDELVRRAAQALAVAELRTPNGRVTQVPDARMIRWYISSGLVDRPLAMRGRVGLYGPRHLLQLVAIKRRQAEGRTLAQIQEELVGATDESLAGIAQVPATPTSPRAEALMPPRQDRFWTRRPVRADAAGGPAVPGPTLLHGVDLGGVVLLLHTVPDANDLAAIAQAAQPLLDLLATRGLLSSSTSDKGARA